MNRCARFSSTSVSYLKQYLDCNKCLRLPFDTLLIVRSNAGIHIRSNWPDSILSTMINVFAFIVLCKINPIVGTIMALLSVVADSGGWHSGWWSVLRLFWVWVVGCEKIPHSSLNTTLGMVIMAFYAQFAAGYGFHQWSFIYVVSIPWESLLYICKSIIFSNETI